MKTDALQGPRQMCEVLNLRINQAATIVAWCSLVFTIIGAVCAHVKIIDTKAWP
jgi:hypothetical protein